MNLGLYRQNTTDVIERVSGFENNVNTVRPENVGTKNNSGVELNAKYNVTNKVTFMGDFNINYFQRKGEFNNQNFDFNGERWNTRLNSKFKLPKNFDMTKRNFLKVQLGIYHHL